MQHPQDSLRGRAEDESNGLINRMTTGTETTLNKAIEDMRRRTCICGRVLKNELGLKIHQGKMKCSGYVSRQRMDATSSQTGEECGPDTNHSTMTLPVERQTPDQLQDQVFEEIRESSEAGSNNQTEVSTTKPTRVHLETKERIDWPPASKKEVWKKLDEDLEDILRTTLKGSVERKLESMSKIIYRIGADRFGIKENKRRKECTSGTSRRQKEISLLRKELKVLTRQWNHCSESEKPGLSQLRQQARKRLLTLKKAENLAAKRRKWKKTRENFIKSPYNFASNLLGKARSGILKCTQEELQCHLKETHNDPQRETPLGDFEGMTEESLPSVPFDTSDISKSEFDNVVKKGRSSSAPGPTGTIYRVYKNCPLLSRRLWRLHRTLWKKGTIPSSWGLAEGVFVPKEENSEGIPKFRPISLLSVELKIYMSIISNRITSYMLTNKYIDTTTQKGGIPGFSGCLEHNAMISEIIHHSKAKKKDLTMIWLDIANAYGSVPHQLIYTALEHYHIPKEITALIKKYF